MSVEVSSHLSYMAKPIQLSIGFYFPEGSKPAKATITPDGEIIFTGKDGNPITPEYMDRALHYSRPKGPKIQSRCTVTGGHVSVSGLQELMKYDSVLVLDTNRKNINHEEVAAACFVHCRFVSEEGAVSVECDGRLNVYEFHNVPETENPEMLGLLIAALDISSAVDKSKPIKIALFTDSELGRHDKINKRLEPIYGDQYLPDGFTLHYASAERGKEVINNLMKFCDKQSSNYLKYLEEGSVKTSDLQPLKEAPTVKHRYMFSDGIEIVNPIIKGIAIGPGTTVSLYGLKK